MSEERKKKHPDQSYGVFKDHKFERGGYTPLPNGQKVVGLVEVRKKYGSEHIEVKKANYEISRDILRDIQRGRIKESQLNNAIRKILRRE